MDFSDFGWIYEFSVSSTKNIILIRFLYQKYPTNHKKRCLIGTNFILIQDGSSFHNSEDTIQALKNLGIFKIP
jgi:hypothetical protein